MDIDKILSFSTEQFEALTDEQRLELVREHLPITQGSGGQPSQSVFNTKDFMSQTPKRKRTSQIADPAAMMRMIQQAKDLAAKPSKPSTDTP